MSKTKMTTYAMSISEGQSQRKKGNTMKVKRSQKTENRGEKKCEV